MRRLILVMMAVLVLTSSIPVKVACIGDSITYGACIEDRDHDSYPSVLQGLLGSDYEVRNFGFSARTMLDKGDYPYMNEKMYQEVKEYLPDIVTIMLGTNDSKPHNWAHKDEFYDNYVRMVRELQELTTHPRIYICLPPAVVKDSFGITENVVLNEVTPLVYKVAADRWLDVIDTRSVTEGRSELYVADGVHPNPSGAAAIAKCIYDGMSLRGDTGKPGKRVLFIGDSITDDDWGKKDGWPVHKRQHYDMNHIYGHGYVLDIAQYYMTKYPERGYKFYNRGISGNRLVNLNERWDDDVTPVHPDVLTIAIGVNDTSVSIASYESFDFEGWEKMYRGLIDKALAANPEVKILLAKPFIADIGAQHIWGHYQMRLPIISRIGEIIDRMASDYGCIVLDFDQVMYDAIAKDKSGDAKYWSWDGIHPTMAGHKLMADHWIRKANKAKIMK